MNPKPYLVNKLQVLCWAIEGMVKDESLSEQLVEFIQEECIPEAKKAEGDSSD